MKDNIRNLEKQRRSLSHAKLVFESELAAGQLNDQQIKSKKLLLDQMHHQLAFGINVQRSVDSSILQTWSNLHLDFLKLVMDHLESGTDALDALVSVRESMKAWVDVAEGKKEYILDEALLDGRYRDERIQVFGF